MEYGINIVFAIRTIRVYRIALRRLPEYDHTLALGALLNIFTVILPNDEFDIDTNALRDKGLPYLDNPSKLDVESYLKTIRNSLAHKTESNFSTMYTSDSDQIFMIDLNSERSKSHLRLTSGDLNLIIEIIDSALRSEYNELYIEEYAR
jgi:hypothetical protein